MQRRRVEAQHREQHRERAGGGGQCVPGAEGHHASGPLPRGAGTAGGSSGVDKCLQSFATVLEDISQCDLYSQFKKIPAPGDPLGIAFDTKRIFAIDANGVKVGALPTGYNYLAACLASGHSYIGIVKASAEKPIPTVEADFGPL